MERDEIIRLLGTTDADEVRALLKAADQERRGSVGDEVYLRGIIEFSNHCGRNCLYCGLRRGNKALPRYRVPDDEIIELAGRVRDLGIATVVLQAGEDPAHTTEYICRLISRIKGATGLAITLSIGERSFDDYRAFKDSGADRYLLKHETANPELYRRLHPDSDQRNRIQCLTWLKELGYETGAGNMVGLPGQTLATLADDILLMRELDIDMIGIGPFIAHPDTPLKNTPTGDLDLVLKVIAVTRLVTGNTNIPATTALATLDPEIRLKALATGANVVMPDFTPAHYKRHYEIYPGRSRVSSDIGQVLAILEKDLAGINRCIGHGPGGRRNRSKG
jgi:biotin synthase